jgi:serine/threonine protein phosphatase PrpC
MLDLEVAIVSERGGRRYNEDACAHWSSQRHLCCVLADGAGGHGGGDVASKLAVRQMLTDFAAQAADSPNLPASSASSVSFASPTSPVSLEALVRGANRSIRQHSVPGTPQADMHTTAVLLVIDRERHLAGWSHAGDSRLYWFRDGRILQRTRDHSLVQSLVDAGLIAEADIRSHPKRSELRSALGIAEDELEIDTAPTAAIEPNDAFLLCTDGLWEHVDETAMQDLLSRSSTAQAWTKALASEVERNTAAMPRHDNYTALAVWVRSARDMPQ